MRRQLALESLEDRCLMAVTSVTVYPVTPTEAVPFGTPGTPVPVAIFVVDNYIGVDQSSQFSADIKWGDGDVSAGLAGPTVQFFQNLNGGKASYQIFGNHTYIDATLATMPLDLTVDVFDNTGPGNTQSSSGPVSVKDLPLAQFILPAVTVTIGAPLTNVDVADFTDGNPYSEPSDLHATVVWSNPTATAPGLIVKDAAGVFHVLSSHTFDSTGAGVRPIAVTITDEDPAVTLVMVNNATVNAAAIVPTAIPVTAMEGSTIPAGTAVGGFTDLGGPQAAAAYINAGTFVAFPGTTGITPLVVVQNGTTNTYTLTTAAAATFIAPIEEGASNYTLHVADSSGALGKTVGSFNVTDAPLTFDAAKPGLTSVEGLPLTNIGLISFNDANTSAPLSDFSATIDWGDGTTAFGTISQPGGLGTPFLVSGSHTFLNDGTFNVVVHVVDVGGSTTTGTATVVVTEAPLVLNPVLLTVSGYKNIGLVNVDLTTFTSGNPFDVATGFVSTISWGDGTPSTAGHITEDAAHVFHVSGNHTYTQSGSFFPAITITENDFGGVLGQTTATVNIQAVPLLVTAEPIGGTEGIALPNAQNTTNGTIVATFINTIGFDPIGSYTATIDWGNGQVTPGTILSLGGPNFEIVAPLMPLMTYAEAGIYTVKVSVTDTNANGAAGFFTAVGVTTATIKDAALIGDPTQPVVNAFQQTPLVAVQVAKFTDANPTAPLSDFSATIDWGDGTPQTAGQVIQPGGVGTAFFVVGNHTFANPTTPPASAYVITSAIKDVDASRLTTHSVANVTASTITGTPVTINGVESQPIVYTTVAYFTDSGIAGPLSSYSDTINWGDQANTVTIGQIVPLGGNVFSVVGTFTYLEENIAPNIPYSITVTINHNGALATTVVSHANIADAPLSGVAVPVFATEGAVFGGTVAIFTDLDPAGMSADYTATINWGDGTTSSGKVVQSGSAFLVQAVDPVSGIGHVYNEEGSYPFFVVVKDVGGATFTAYQTATVADAALTVTGINATATEGPLPANPLPGIVIPTFNLATFTDAGNTVPSSVDLPSAYTATINWGDGTVTTGTVGNPTLIGNSVIFPVSGQHLYKYEGTFQTTITIKDEGGSTAQTVSIVTITDAALTAGPANVITEVEGVPFLAQVATFTDANLAANIADHSATINWGDGTSSAGIIGQLSTAVGSPTQFTVSGSHTYVEESVTGTPYAITVSIKDINGGSSATATATAVVLDAPLTSTGTSIQGVEGIPLSAGVVGNGILVATVQDSDPLATVSDFAGGGSTVTLDWGDGSALVTIPAANVVAVGSPAGVTFKVFGGPHIYMETGSYQITVTATDAGGAVTVAHSEADIADAPLVPGAVQPILGPQSEGVSFSAAVVGFLDTNPTAPTSDHTATIDWGDGTPRSTGTIIQPGGLGNPFFVVGSHNYINPLVSNGKGFFPIVVNVIDKDGASTVVTNSLTLTPTPIAITGQLNPASDTGESNQDAITNDNAPNFFGTIEPFSNVTLYVAPTGSSSFVAVGTTTANGSGGWNITSNVLVDGSYTVKAVAVDRSGVGTASVQILPNSGQGPLVIDTVGPKVTSISFARLSSAIIATFQDERSGLDNTTVVDAANYQFTRSGFPIGHLLVTALPITTAGGPTAPETVVITINNAKRQLRGGMYTMLIRSGGIRDIAGNALDGEFYGFFPSGNNKPGGDFVARLDARHSKIFAPKTIIGTATPLHPPGTPAHGSTLNQIVIPPNVVPLTTSATLMAKAHLHATRTIVGSKLFKNVSIRRFGH